MHEKDDSLDMISPPGITSPYRKRYVDLFGLSMASSVLRCNYLFDSAAVNPRHSALLQWTNSVIWDSLFAIHVLLQQHGRIWPGHLEAKGDFPQSNQVQAAINRVHKDQHRRENASYWKGWGEYLHGLPITTGIWDAEQPTNWSVENIPE